jgi:hypothetical protein
MLLRLFADKRCAHPASPLGKLGAQHSHPQLRPLSPIPPPLPCLSSVAALLQSIVRQLSKALRQLPNMVLL